MDDQKKQKSGLNAETRRIPKSLIEEQIRLEKERAEALEKEKKAPPSSSAPPPEPPKVETREFDNSLAPDDPNAPAIDLSQQKKTEVPAGDVDSTQTISLADTMTVKRDSIPKQEEAPKRPVFNSEIHVPTPPKKSSMTPWLAVIILIIFSAIVFYMIRSKSNTPNPTADQQSTAVTSDAVDEEVDEGDPITEDVDEQSVADGSSDNEMEPVVKLKPAFLEKAVFVKSFSINNTDLSGKAQIKIRKKGAIFSELEDSKTVAITYALLKRIEVLGGMKQKKTKGILTKQWRGNLRGYRLTGFRKHKTDQEFTENLTLVTPASGRLSVINGVLASVKKVTFENFIKSLEAKGILIKDIESTDENQVELNLDFKADNKAFGKKDFLLSSSGIFGVKGGGGIESIGLNLPKGFRDIPKEIEVNETTFYKIHKIHDDKFQPLFYVKEWENKIANVEITSPRIKIREGIGIGSTIGELRILFPELTIAVTKGKVVVVQYPEIGGYFIVNASVKEVANETIADSKKITKIVLE